MIALSAAESLTDDLAAYLLELAGMQEREALISALHVCDFVFERNSEWHLAARARDYLLRRLLERRELFRAAHGRLLEVSRSPALREQFSEIPRYLLEGTGRAYHSSALNPAVGLLRYSDVAVSDARGQQWLAARLAREQQTLGILPRESLEIDFLQGMVYYREGRVADAEPLLRRVAGFMIPRREVAIALYIVGRLDGRRGRTRRAEAELNRSLEIERNLGNAFGEALVLHALGQLIGRDRQRASQAEELLRRSLEVGEQLENRQHQAQVLHTLGQLIGRDRQRASQAEELLRRSLELLQNLDDALGQAQVLYTWGKIRSRSDRQEGIGLLRRSLAINEEKHNSEGVELVRRELRRMQGDSS